MKLCQQRSQRFFKETFPFYGHLTGKIEMLDGKVISAYIDRGRDNNIIVGDRFEICKVRHIYGRTSLSVIAEAEVTSVDADRPAIKIVSEGKYLKEALDQNQEIVLRWHQKRISI